MGEHQSLDSLVAKKAVEFADQIKAAAAMADKEEEIRVEVERQLAFVQKEAGVKLRGKHEFTVASGRIDSVYNAVIIEYKNPASPASRIGPRPDSPGAKKVVEQIKSRFYDLRSKETLNTLFGVGCDGNYFIFVRFYNDKWQVQDPVEVNKHSAERFLWALLNLGTKGKRFEPDYLAGDFGSAEGSVASAGIKVLYDAISTTTNPKAQTFFNQWKILFGEVCGYDVDNPSDKIKKLADFYGVPTGDVKPAELLFGVHTYYALFMKLLAGEIIGHFHKLPSLIGRMLAAPSAAKLKSELAELEAGGIFRHLGITNFLEGDLFAWYLPAWSDDIEGLVRKMTARLDQYNPGTLAEEPAESRDMLKRLYHQLFPRSVRHDLGEYYTPDWLAEHVLNELGYVGNPDKRLLDPACGSGTFLVMAITRILSWYEKNREKLRYDEGELCKKILANVVGFDLNPLAVMAARTNYLIAMRKLFRRDYIDKVEIPVYLCDSIMTPSEYGEAKQGEMFGRPMRLRTSAKPSPFFIPREVVNDAQVLAAYTNKLQSLAAKNSGHSADEFLEQCRNDGIPVTSLDDHKRLFGELRKLDEDDKNGVWARIIKNAFAPLFVGKVDYVAGNPPWVFWNNLPNEYRDSVRQLMADTYRIMAKGASTMKRLGSAGKDLSMLFFYVGLDVYLRDKGKLGYVITQTIFQSTAGNEFRKFRLPKNRPLRVKKVEDWVRVQPFRPKAGNKTAVVIAANGAETEYPLPYDTFIPIRDFDRESASLDEVLSSCERAAGYARPHDADDKTSFWTVESSKDLIEDTTSSVYHPRLGVETKLEALFRVRVLRRVKSGVVLVENILDRAKIPLPQVTAAVEDALLLPYVTGASISRWHYTTPGYYVTPHTAETGMEPLSIATMKSMFPKTFEYFNRFKKELEGRSLHQRWGKDKPFYSMYDIGPYTFAPYKVAWKRTTKDFSAVVLSTIDDALLGNKVVVPNGKVMIVPFESEDAAHFLCGVLNSTMARERINRAITSEAHRDIINVVPLEKYDAKRKDHLRIMKLSKDAHDAAQREELDEVTAIEEQLDEAVTKLWRAERQ
jgi:hypothetical protein